MTQEKDTRQTEEGVEVPYERINPETLRNLIQEFVSRDGADWGDAGCSLKDKVNQVLGQLKAGKARVVFDLKTETANIVVRP
ncbi:YheU family protein [Geoalkalibacter halelectricus]|uniref:YheU family protein n=1 Tax=Geoalkalibacter halelectricus TaxID=2847045 RepID=UPI003D1C0D48